jgi:hypothetical protein
MLNHLVERLDGKELRLVGFRAECECGYRGNVRHARLSAWWDGERHRNAQRGGSPPPTALGSL